MNSNFFSLDLAKIIVKCIEDATGDVIREDLARSELIYQNSTPHRVWDYIFSLLTKRLEVLGFTVISTNSGPWRFPIIYDSSSGNIITIMREKRFADLQRQQRKRNKLHYIDMLTATLNKDLLPQFRQMTLLEKPHRDLEEIKTRVSLMLHDFGENADMVRNHVLVLFDAHGFNLYSVRAVKVTPYLEVAVDGELNLSHLIKAEPSVIMDKVVEHDALTNNPTQGLKLKAKAIQRKENVKIKDKSKEANATNK